MNGGEIALFLLASAERRVDARLRAAADADIVDRVWAKDDTVWGAAGQADVADRLGWLTIAERMLDSVERLDDFAEGVRADGLTDCVLLGMGGSSLAPEVFARTFGSAEGALRLHVLDTTDAAAVARAPTENTLYLVSSKSGGTIETISALHRFWASTGGDGSRFAAITDPHTTLESLAKERGFRAVFLNDPDIGGRYSALSYFGLVPAALIGAPVQQLLAGAVETASACRRHGEDNPGLKLGCAWGELALAGHDKANLFIDDELASLGLWAEQLIAESLGKDGRGILPIADEPRGPVQAYGNDRMFVRVGSRGGASSYPNMRELTQAGHPMIGLHFDSPEDLGSVMFVLEFATAIAGWVLGVNPFDQPDVQAAKDRTAAVLASDSEPIEPASDSELAELLRVAPPGYVAFQVYAAPDDAIDSAMRRIRERIVTARGVATTFGYGPRYLHSTGQLHKGGPPVGRFVQVVVDGPEDLPVPDEDYGFDELKHAQADGDLLTLREAGLPALRVAADGGWQAIESRIQGALG